MITNVMVLQNIKNDDELIVIYVKDGDHILLKLTREAFDIHIQQAKLQHATLMDQCPEFEFDSHQEFSELVEQSEWADDKSCCVSSPIYVQKSFSREDEDYYDDLEEEV